MTPRPTLPRGIELGRAAHQLVDHGAGTPLTFDEASARVAHLSSASKADLTEAIAYLACQVVGHEHSSDLHAQLALQQIARIVTDYQERTR